jgi:hypothetical protein
MFLTTREFELERTDIIVLTLVSKRGVSAFEMIKDVCARVCVFRARREREKEENRTVSVVPIFLFLCM